jgi:hypothetical protein
VPYTMTTVCHQKRFVALDSMQPIYKQGHVGGIPRWVKDIVIHVGMGYGRTVSEIWGGPIHRINDPNPMVKRVYVYQTSVVQYYTLAGPLALPLLPLVAALVAGRATS